MRQDSRQDSQRSDRRRRGPRRDNRGGGNGEGRRESSYYPAEVGRAGTKRPGLWQKIVSFFTGESAAAARPARPASSSSRDYPKRERSESAPRTSARKPEVVEVSSPKLYIGNLSFDATESDLFDLFNGVGQVQNAEIVSHKYTQKSKGFAFVTMQTVEEARRAVSELHDKDFMGRKLVVSGAKTNDMRDAA